VDRGVDMLANPTADVPNTDQPLMYQPNRESSAHNQSHKVEHQVQYKSFLIIAYRYFFKKIYNFC
jgi:hypothetical protein